MLWAQQLYWPLFFNFSSFIDYSDRFPYRLLYITFPTLFFSPRFLPILSLRCFPDPCPVPAFNPELSCSSTLLNPLGLLSFTRDLSQLSHSGSPVRFISFQICFIVAIHQIIQVPLQLFIFQSHTNLYLHPVDSRSWFL